MAGLQEQEVMVEVMDQIEGLWVEEMVNCIDCNISVSPSNIQVIPNKQTKTIEVNFLFAGARYEIPRRGWWYNGQPLQ